MAPISKPFRCQLALQGGGAKIVALMAAMEGVQKLQSTGRIKVTRIAGTSAGSIVAAMFAAGIDLGQARLQMQADLGAKIANLFYKPTKAGMLWRIGVRGLPLWEEKNLASILTPYFERAKVMFLSDLFDKTQTHVHIVASVLSDARKQVHSDTSSGMPIVSALLDSCAIPYCFRIWQTAGPVIVDGGLCENLPSDELLEHESTDGPVIAMSFRSPLPGTQRSLQEFSLALLDTAISNSVTRARTRLGIDRVCEIQTSVTTFDFVEATAFAPEEAEKIRSEAADFVDGFVRQERLKILGNPWKELNVGTMEDLWKIYSFQHLDRAAAQNTASSVVVQANCLVEEPEGPSFGQPDYVFFQTEFKAVSEMFCYHVAVVPSSGPGTLYSSEIEVTGHDGEPVNFVLVPARDSANPGKRLVLVYFTPTLPTDSGPYRIRVTQSIPNFMKELKEKSKDELFLMTKQTKGPIGRIDLVLHVPKGFINARAIAKADNPRGREMVRRELDVYTSPPGFRTIGWRGENLEPGKFGCDVIL
jgi:predicted acylesterase/phospholipase RssA